MVKRKRQPTVKLSLSALSSSVRAGSLSDAEAWMQNLVRPIALDERATARQYRPRLKLVFLVIGLVFGVLSLRLMSLQLLTGERYLLAAEGNRIRDDIAYAPRGTIYDRHGRVLAHNGADYQLSVTPYLLPRDAADRQIAYNELAPLLGLSASALQTQAEAEGLAYNLPILIADHLSHEQMLKIEQSLPGLVGFTVDTVPVREYAAEAGLAHVLGYVGRVNKADLASRQDILPTDFVGRSGVEQQYDSALRGRNGRSRVEVDALGRPIRLLAKQTAQTGTDITLTIDYNLQVELERQLRAQMQTTGATRASSVMLDPETGEVLAMVSIPYYDNNRFVRGLTQADYDALVNDPDQPLINRVIASAYPSGSTIKPLVASAALQEQVVTDQTVIVDRGAITIPNQYDPSIIYTFRGWRAGGLGPMTLRRAIAMSSNIYFYTVAGGYGDVRGLGAGRLTSYYRQFGLGEKSGIDLPGELAGRVPDPEWKERTFHEPWFLGDTYNIAIGQGELKVTPLQITLANLAIANGGRLLQPRVLKAIHRAGEPALEPQVRRHLPIDVDYLNVVREGMHEMIYQGAYSPARFTSIPVEIAGKTGTAETDKINPDSQPHAWFVAYGPWDRARVGLGLMVEQGEKSANALNPAIATLSYYFTR